MIPITSTLRLWTGNIDELAKKVGELTRLTGQPEAEAPTIRLVRDYVQRGLLGPMVRTGKELIFNHDNLVRFLATRTLLQNGWTLHMIALHLSQTSMQDIEHLIPTLEGTIPPGILDDRPEDTSRLQTRPSSTSLRLAAARATNKTGLRRAMRNLHLPAEGPATDEVMFVRFTDWFQVLIRSERISSITPEEAQELGKAVTITLLNLASKMESNSCSKQIVRNQQDWETIRCRFPNASDYRRFRSEYFFDPTAKLRKTGVPLEGVLRRPTQSSGARWKIFESIANGMSVEEVFQLAQAYPGAELDADVFIALHKGFLKLVESARLPGTAT